MKTNNILWWRKICKQLLYRKLYMTRKLSHDWEADFWNRIIVETENQSVFHYEGYSKMWGCRKHLFYKGGWRWGNPPRMQFELAGKSSHLKDLFSPYFILRVIVVRQEVIENVDSFESKWKQLALLKYFFQSFIMKDYKLKTLQKYLPVKH